MYIFKKESNIIKIENQKTIENLKNSELIKETDNVLDFGCGLGIWNVKEPKEDIFFNKLYMYDKNNEVREQCKKKYSEHTVLDDIKNNLNINLIFSNGVIQYIEINDLKKLFEQFATMLKKDEMVVISCLPRYSRVIECILTFFTDYNLFKRQVKQFLRSSYRETKFYRHSIDELKTITENHFSLKKIKNIDPNKNRYTICFKKTD